MTLLIVGSNPAVPAKLKRGEIMATWAQNPNFVPITSINGGQRFSSGTLSAADLNVIVENLLALKQMRYILSGTEDQKYIDDNFITLDKINGGNKYSACDFLFSDDVNRIKYNIFFLREMVK